jgi:hypothetical protein
MLLPLLCKHDTLAALSKQTELMVLLPIDIDETRNSSFLRNPECVSVLNVCPFYYAKIGFHKPWIGYFACLDGRWGCF